MYCIKCGKQKEENENFCKYCGNSFAVRSETIPDKNHGMSNDTSRKHKRICVRCGKKLGPCKNVQVKDKEYFCNSCWGAAGFNTWGDLFDKPYMYTSKDIIDIIDNKKTHDQQIREFVATADICPSAKFNDNTRQMILADHMLVYVTNDPQNRRTENYSLFSYDQIVEFELLENGEGIASGGVGRALVGGLLFGGVGAIVGATTRNYQTVCKELKIKLTVKDYKDPAFYIPLIVFETNRFSNEYQEKMKMAHDILSKFQLITDSRDAPVSDNQFEEIRKYKALLDEGIITQEDFEKKKKELLGI